MVRATSCTDTLPTARAACLSCCCASFRPFSECRGNQHSTSPAAWSAASTPESLPSVLRTGAGVGIVLPPPTAVASCTGCGACEHPIFPRIMSTTRCFSACVRNPASSCLANASRFLYRNASKKPRTVSLGRARVSAPRSSASSPASTLMKNLSQCSPGAGTATSPRASISAHKYATTDGGVPPAAASPPAPGSSPGGGLLQTMVAMASYRDSSP
mmetsp:Transcript_32887/g.104689  ORF Transcript_32887/g.104689 Transcript_32887/m.104689 type:complete len:215 (-) Transcript_32887:200-844(-)